MSAKGRDGDGADQGVFGRGEGRKWHRGDERGGERGEQLRQYTRWVDASVDNERDDGVVAASRGGQSGGAAEQRALRAGQWVPPESVTWHGRTRTSQILSSVAYVALRACSVPLCGVGDGEAGSLRHIVLLPVNSVHESVCHRVHLGVVFPT